MHDAVVVCHSRLLVREVLIIDKLLVVLLFNELFESFFVHVRHQLAKYIWVVNCHVLQELRQLINGDSHRFSVATENFNELYRVVVEMPIVSILIQLHLPNRLHHTRHVVTVVMIVEWIQVTWIVILVLVYLFRRLLSVTTNRVIRQWNLFLILFLSALSYFLNDP